MFSTSITALSAAQHEAVDSLLEEARESGAQVDGILFENNVNFGNDTRAVLVIDNHPVTGSEYDRVYSFDGDELTQGEESNAYFAAQTLDALAREGLADDQLVA